MKLSIRVFFALLLAGLVHSAHGQQYPRASLWQQTIDDFKRQDYQASMPQGMVLFIGSSTFTMWNSLKTDFPDSQVLNRAFGGSMMSDLLYFFNDIVVPYQPRQIVIYEGDNDLESNNSNADLFYNQVVAMVRLIHIYYPATEIVLVSIKPSPSRVAAFARYQAANAKMKALADAEPYIQFVDMWDAMLDSKGNPVEEYYLTDRLHMNAKGYAVWRDILKPYLISTESENRAMLAKALADAYQGLGGWGFCWPGIAMHNYPTADSYVGSERGDGGPIRQFEDMTFAPDNGALTDYYMEAYSGIARANKALAIAEAITWPSPSHKAEAQAEALFLRALFHFRLAQAFGDVVLLNSVPETTDIKSRSPRTAVYTAAKQDLQAAIPHLPTRVARLGAGQAGRATANAARALLAKVCLYQQDYAGVLEQTSLIIASSDNSLGTPFDRIFDEDMEFGPESVFEVDVDVKPSLEIERGSNYAEIQGVRGQPNLGWGFNVPAQALMDAYEVGDPRKDATIIVDGDDLEGDIVQATVGMTHKFFNKKAYAKKAERQLYGRENQNGRWKNIRLIRYADVVLMHAEAANELGQTAEALDKLEMVRARARGANSSVLPKVTDTDQAVLRGKVRHERRVELAMEFEHFFDLVRWGVAKGEVPGFVQGRHEVYPIPQVAIDVSEGVVTQNPGY